MIRSRLRRPTSKSTTHTLCPPCARAAPRAAVVVVLPTPPLPDVTTRTFATRRSPLIQACHSDVAVIEPDLGGLAAQGRAHVLRRPHEAVDPQQLGFELAAVDSCARVARRPGDRASAQGAVDVDGAAGQDLGPRGDRTHHGYVAGRVDDTLAGADRALDGDRGD